MLEIFDENNDYVLYKTDTWGQYFSIAKGKGWWCINTDDDGKGFFDYYTKSEGYHIYFARRKRLKFDKSDSITIVIRAGDIMYFNSNNEMISKMGINIPTNKINIFE